MIQVTHILEEEAVTQEGRRIVRIWGIRHNKVKQEAQIDLNKLTQNCQGLTGTLMPLWPTTQGISL